MRNDAYELSRSTNRKHEGMNELNIIKWSLLIFPLTMALGIRLQDPELVISGFVIYPFAIYAYKLIESMKE